jgi:hypothetical protein
LVVLQVVVTQGSGGAPGVVVVDELFLRLPVGQALPIELKLQVEPVRDPCGPVVGTVIGDFDPCRMFDDAPFIEMRERGRNTANEMPAAVPAGEKIGHGKTGVLDEMLDVLLDESLALDGGKSRLFSITDWKY